MNSIALSYLKSLSQVLKTNANDDDLINPFLNKICEILNTDIFIVDNFGNISHSNISNFTDFITLNDLNSFIADSKFLTYISTLLENKFNLLPNNLFIKSSSQKYFFLILPLIFSGNKVSTAVIYRNKKFEEDIEIVSEYINSVLSSLIFNYNNFIDSELKRQKSIIKSSIGTLSYSELEAILAIFEELNSTEGIIVASKIADKFQITRSVIVNALRKFESAEIIESRSLGMKGTYIKVLNKNLFDELFKYKK